MAAQSAVTEKTLDASKAREVGEHRIQSSRVCAVVVTYNPQSALLENLLLLTPQVGHIVLVDNGSGSDAQDLLKQAKSGFGCELILNDENLGIAKALNIGIARAAELGCDAVVLFDQDSVVNRGYIEAMLHTYEQQRCARPVGIVVPTYRDRISGKIMRLIMRDSGELLSSMTSGSLVPMRAFAELGMHDESLYMDFVDIEISLRFRRAGCRIIEAPGAELRHSVGRRTDHTLFGRPFASSNHSPNRRYYITRNRLILLREYCSDWPWSFREARAIVTEAIKILLVEDQKFLKCRRMSAAIVDAVRGRMGKRFEL